tara:strand:- start:5259 stop:5801 length:543 start_codon:yes stop_codon:yes gene_type:complete
MNTHKEILTEQIVVYGDIRTDSSKIDNKLVTERIAQDASKQPHTFDNLYHDININYHGQHSWIFDLIRENINVHAKVNFINYKNWANSEGFNQNSFKRSTLDPNQIKGQPDYTLIYITNAGDNAGELVLEFDSPVEKDKYFWVPVKTGNFYLFNSNINYYFTRNLDKENRVSMTWTCSKR